MTSTRSYDSIIQKATSTLLPPLMLSVMIFYSAIFSSEASGYMLDGMSLAIKCVIPSSFPFMVLSDIYVSYGKPESIYLLSSFLSSILGVPKAALAAFICGNIGGFPIGAKMVSDAYREGRISRSEAERILPLCNNPSCAFIIGAVGMGMYGDIKLGILLTVSVFASTLICGMATRTPKCKTDFSDYITRQSYSFVNSVKAAGASSVNIISFISIFCVALGIIKKRVKYAPILYIIYAFSEVSNAVKSFSELHNISPILSIALSAFSLGFGGACVAMQSTSFTTSCGLKMRRYYSLKFLQGIISSALSVALYTVNIKI